MNGPADLRISLGAEEEFFLVDPDTRDILTEPSPEIFAECERRIGPHKVTTEFLRSQIETNTRVCGSVAELADAMRETRRVVVKAAARHGAAVMAASTHPFAAWTDQLVTPRERYRDFAIVYQESLRRFLVGGMHIHAGFGDGDSRIRVMTAIRRYMPLLHALSASSPFNQGRVTGFKSFRLNLVGALPRTGLPGALWSRAEYDELVESYRRLDFIQNGSELWWDIRPSHSYPTIELRICDVCTRLADAVSIAALYACLTRFLLRLDRDGKLPPEPPTEIIAENRWIAQRYGVLAFLGDIRGRGEAGEEAGNDGGEARGDGDGNISARGRIDVSDHAARLVEELAEDAAALECEQELARVLEIAEEGSGADRQVDHYRLRRLEGDSHHQALRSVVELILSETKDGTAES